MCGIAVILRFNPAAVAADILAAMTAEVAHRGPDAGGAVFLARATQSLVETPPAADWRVALGHRRLAILDLSESGRQPMRFADRCWIAYNGEVYNFIELRTELESLGYSFRTRTDTEVILAAYDAWGDACWQRLRGMWAVALVDGRRGRLVLSRDRLGIKPLYMLSADGFLAVASEIKQFRCLDQPRLRPNLAALRQYLLTGYERTDQTFFADVEPVAPATWQAIDLETGRANSPQAYWFPEQIQPTIFHLEEAAPRFRQVLCESVRIHLRSDVPVGCALSGGLDSSAIAVCIDRVQSGEPPPLHTFSVVFPGTEIDERRQAEIVIRTIRARPHFITPAPESLLEDLDRFVWVHDEPVGSLAQYAAYALAQAMRRAGVPVALNGQGGDEALGGYWQSCFMYLRGLARSRRLCTLARQLVGAAAPAGNRELWRQVPVMWRRYRARTKASLQWRDSASAAHDSSGNGLVSQWMDMDDHQRRLHELRYQYLPRLLKWDDRNFMAFSIEGRYPFLDHVLLELALSFSPDLLYRNGWTKQPLRAALEGWLPREILRRRTKLGFETPQNRWLQQGLRPAVQSWLEGDSPLWQYVDPAQVQALAAHVSQSDAASQENGQTLLRLFLADRWLRCFFQ